MALIAETAALRALQDQLATIMRSGGVTINCGRFSVANITGGAKAPASAKADFVLMSGHQPRLFISHKATGFSHNGYGSGGNKAFPHRSPYRSELIWEFASWAADYCMRTQQTTVDASGLFRWTGPERGIWCIPPRNVGNLIVYGPRFGESAYGLYNCHVAAVGAPRLASAPEGYTLSFDGGIESNGDIPRGDDAPIIGIGGCIASQKDVYLLRKDGAGIRGFHGWLAFFPYRLVREAEERAMAGKPGRGKADGMIRTAWQVELAGRSIRPGSLISPPGALAF